MHADASDIEESKKSPQAPVDGINELIMQMNDSSAKARSGVDPNRLNNSFVKSPFVVNNDIFYFERCPGTGARCNRQTRRAFGS